MKVILIIFFLTLPFIISFGIVLYAGKQARQLKDENEALYDDDKIIFLDIDGVLNVASQERDRFGTTFHKHFEDNLEWIIEKTRAKIVISSTWRMSGLEIMQEMWKERGLAGEVIDITPTEIDVVERGTCEFFDQVDRGFEIQQWIDDNNIKRYCIIDDDNDMLPSQKNNFVRTANNKDHPDSIDIGYGLTKQCAELVVSILSRSD